MRLAVYADGSVVVTAPIGMRESLADRFVEEKQDWILKKIALFEKFAGHALTKSSKEDYLLYKDRAFNLATARIEYFNKIYGFDFNKISIRNQKTRWGSCSRKGNLNFNYKIALLPPQIADYIIVHELGHLGEFNHSKRFWDLVARTVPEHKKIRRDLKTHNFLQVV
jgi:hypothetical protein